MRRTVCASSKLFPAVGVAMILAGCGRDIESGSMPRAQEAALTSLGGSAPHPSEENRYVTHLYSERDADVYSHLAGDEDVGLGLLIRAIHVEVGDRVAAGQVLATLEDDDAALDVEAAQAKAEEARAHFARTEELRRGGFASASDYDAALSARRRAEAELKRAQLDLSRTRIRAPFGGVVARRYVRVGERVEETKPLFRITAMSPLRARLRVPEDRSAAFHPGAAVQLTGADGARAEARVLLVGPTVDPGSGTREVIVELAEPGEFVPGAAVVAQPPPSPRRAGQ